MDQRPHTDEYPSYFETYISLVKGENILLSLEKQLSEFKTFILRIPNNKELYTYERNKWTIKEVIGHIIDTERIMAYRVLRFSRKDTNELTGFDENEYVKECNYNRRSMSDLLNEFTKVREGNMYLFKNINPDNFSFKGTANGKQVTVRALLYIIAGHVIHHMEVIKNRYLQ